MKVSKGYTSTTSSKSAKPYSAKRLEISFMAGSQSQGDRSFSNLFAASVKMPIRRAVLLTKAGKKLADSIRIFFVLLLTSALFPPLTPAIAKGPRLSAITTSSSPREISLLSKVIILSPFFASPTKIFPLILSQSKQ